MGTLIDKLEAAVDDWIRRILDDLAKKTSKVLVASWQGYEGSLGKARLNSTGTIVTGKVVGDGHGAPLGTKCYYDGKTIELPKRVKHKKTKFKNQSILQALVKKNGKRRGSVYDSPVVFVGLAANQFSKFTGVTRWISTPSGEIQLSEGGNLLDQTLYVQQFQEGNFWLDDYAEPPTYGFYVTPPMRLFGGDSLTTDDDICLAPYVHYYDVLPAVDLGLRVWWWDGSPVDISGEFTQLSSLWTFPECIPNFQINSIRAKNSVFCGAGLAAVLPTPQISAILNTGSMADVPFEPGDRVTMAPDRSCQVYPDPENPCIGDYYPADYVTNGSPDLTAVRLNGCNIFITAKFVAAGASWAGYEGKVVLQGIPEPTGNGNAGSAAQYGYIHYALVPDQESLPSTGSLAEGFASLPAEELTIQPLSVFDWVVSDSANNEPPPPPHPYGDWFDFVLNLATPWYTSSRNGVMWGYEVHAVNRLANDTEWVDGFASVSKDEETTGSLNLASVTMCRERTLSTLDRSRPTPEDEEPPYDPYNHNEFVVIRYRLDTVNRTVDHDVYEWISASPDCISSFGGWPCGYWDPALEEMIESCFYDDDPRVQDGIVGKGVTIPNYNFSLTTGRLHFLPGGYFTPTPKYNSAEYSTEFVEMYYANCPDDIEVGTMQFAQWVTDAFDGSIPIDDYGEAVYEWPLPDRNKIREYMKEATDWTTINPGWTACYPVLRYSPKAGPPGYELLSPEEEGPP